MTSLATRTAFAPTSRLEGLTAYRSATRPQPIDLRLDGNEGPAPPAQDLRLEAEALRRYPDVRQAEVNIAQALGAPSNRELILGAGADELLDRVSRAFVNPGDRVVWTTPGFSMIPRAVGLAEGRLIDVPWTDGGFPVEAFAEAARGSEAALALVASPNNPTGLALSIDELLQLRRALGERALVLDLVYDDYADEPLFQRALELRNTIVIGSASKAHSLAGLRIGWALGEQPVIADLRRAGPPYAVATPSLRLVEDALRDLDDTVRDGQRKIQGERERLGRTLQSLGVRVTASQANFVWVRSPRADFLADALAGLGVGVRLFPGEAGGAPSLRITLPGDDASFARLEAALDTIFRPDTILFDLDGVLADVSRSYREAIRRTAADFDVEVSDEEIAEAKRRGDANDDWRLSQSLLETRGKTLPLETVREHFEAHYQGSPRCGPGLWKSESRLITASALQELAGDRQLGIVTGRPRGDAIRFLTDAGLLDLFGTVVAREDAPALKPSSTPVRIALNRLGTNRAWMLGDTPDDIVAARGAGVLPIGVIAPGADLARDTEVLLTSGAARVLGRVEELGGLLP